MPFHVTINGELTDVSHIDPDTPLLRALRDLSLIHISEPTRLV